MAKETVTKSSRFYCISLIPDFCKTPVGPATPPLPYTIKGEFKETSAESKNVKSHSEPVFLHDKSFIPSVTGDEPGTAKGIKSNTVGKRVESLTFSTTYGSNATKTTQEGRIVWMNDRNTIGQIYERGGQGAKPLQSDLTSKFEATFNDTGAKVKSSLSALSGEINQKTKEVGHALTDAGNSLLNKLSNKIDETRIALQPLARKYKDDISGSMHQFGQDAMDTGGKVAMVSGGVAIAGAGVAATGIGAPVAVVMEAGAAAGGTVGGTVAAVGAGADSGATMLDKAADYILTGKKPDLVGAAKEIGGNLAEGYIMRKLGPLLGKILPKKMQTPPGKPQPPKKPEPAKPKPEQPPNRKGMDGGKEKPSKQEKKDKPKDECPKTCATPTKPAKAGKPVHYGTGEEILYQTDFNLGGSLPLSWTRCYRSGSEAEDWGVLGARWSSEFTESLSVCKRGMVFHDATGRCLRLPLLAIGAELDHAGDGFIIRRTSDDEFTMTWRDGQHHILQRGPNGWLPHGYDGVNMMLKSKAPLLVRRYHLVRSQARDGRGYTVERWHQALSGQVMLRIRNDDGRVLEAIRSPVLSHDLVHQSSTMAAGQGSANNFSEYGTYPGMDETQRIGQVDEVMPDGSRICHVRYDYVLEQTNDAFPAADYFEAPEAAFIALPVRANLAQQQNRLGHVRHYGYRHHLLTRYSNYAGFGYELDWISLAALRERWRGSDMPLRELAHHFPLYLSNSYQARSVATRCSDGSWPYLIDYLDSDTTLVTEPDGSRFEFHFNEQWLVTRTLQYLPGQHHPQLLGKRRWSKDGFLLEEIDAERRSTCYEYDASGNLTTHIDANGQITRTSFNASNQPVRIIDAMGQVTQMDYDAAGRILCHTDALRQSTRYEYDSAGKLIAVVDAKGGRSQLAYDSAGNLQTHVDCSGFATRYEYDASGNLIAQINALGQTTGYRYDALNRLQGIVYPDGSGEQLEFDDEDNLLCHTNLKGLKTHYRYNGQNQPIERIDSNGVTMQYLYDAALRLVELKNGNSESYRFGYHPQGWLASETGFDGKTTKYEYDATGRLKSSESAGQKTEYLRDPLGQLLAKLNADGQVRYAYDALGRLIAVAAPQGEQHFRFDAIGQLLEERGRVKIAAPDKTSVPVSIGQDTPLNEMAFSLRHSYDELGNRLQTVLPNGRKIDTLRYGSGHWHGTLWQGQSVVDLERDGLHRESARSMGHSLQAFRSYDAQSRLSRFSFRRGEQSVQQREYHYDPAGNLTGIQDNRRGFLYYEYDPLGQLLRASQPGLAESFRFDPAGNLLDPQPEGSLQNQPYPETATRPHAELAKVTHNLLQSWLGMQYEYDVQGNTVLKRPLPAIRGIEQAEVIYEYDAENRLVLARKVWADKQSIAEYTYDAFNRRTSKRVTQEIFDASQSKVSRRQITTTFFVWDGDNLVQEIDNGKTITYLYEADSFIPLARIKSQEAEEIYARGTVYLPHIAQWDLPSLQNSASAHVIAWQNWQGEQYHMQLRQQRELQAELAAATDTRHYYQCDHLGTPLELFDADGATVWAARYQAWGKVWETEVDKVVQPLRFQGQYFDAETGLHYNRHRYYDPETARFITQDLIGLEGGENLYSYTPNPTHWIDPLGLQKKPCKNLGGLDWNSIVSQSGENRRDHVRDGHGKVNPNKPKQTLFFKDPVKEINAAWRKRMKRNPCPDSSDAVSDTYVIDMRRPVGYDRDSGAVTNKVTIHVSRNTNKIITGYPLP